MRFFLAAMLAILVMACGPAASSGPASSGPASSGSATSASIAPTAAPPTNESATPTATTTQTTTQTDTEWGRIWDAVPRGYPRYPGSTSAGDAGPGPVSLAYVVGGVDADAIATWMQTAMETATYSTEALSGPLEDGQFVLDSVGDDGCRIETTIAPAGGLILVTVRYGAACPAP